MEPTNPNANTFEWLHMPIFIFSERGGPVINLSTQNYHSDFCVHKHLRHVTAEHTHLAKSFFGHSDGALLQNCLVGLSCGTLLYDTLVGHSCGTLLWDTLVGHSCGALL